MKVTKTNIEDLVIIEGDLFSDNRGEFRKIYSEEQFNSIDVAFKVKQINRSINLKKGTVRGMHYQVPPAEESKIIICTKGKIRDTVIDLRKFSKTFLQHFSIDLVENKNIILLIPPGFAHGFQTLENNTEVIYVHSYEYAPEHERCLNIKDPQINVKWPLDISEISERDKKQEYLKDNFEGITL